jgi:bla regulator protein BlaR1
MSGFDLFCMRFALATLACLAAGAGVAAVCALCRRYLPLLALQRSAWLLGQLAIAATFILVLLPQTAPLRMVPAIEVSEAAPSAPAAALDGASVDGGSLAAPASGAAIDWPLRGAQGWLALYLLGLALALLRLWRSSRAVDRLARAGAHLSSADPHAGFIAGTVLTPAVIEVDAAISPMLCGVFRPRLLLPRHLRSFEVLQQQLIVAHELTHWRRGDLRWTGAAVALQTLFWFHPAMRLLRAHLSWAQELACDRDVLRGRPQAARKAYAAALLAQLKTRHRPGEAVLAFGGASGDTLASRIGLIRAPLAAVHGALSRTVALLALGAVFAVNLALQPALAWHAGAPVPLAAGVVASPANGELDCTLLVDASSGRRLQQLGDCDTRVTPASTFNIAVSLMGFDSGILRDAHSPLLPFRPGYADWNRNWRRATDPTRWIKDSTVWYAQHVTNTLGEARLAQYLDTFAYGNRDASGDAGAHNGLSMSWISSSMLISPVEQAAFLRKVVNRQLPLSAHAYTMSAQLLRLPDQGGWQVFGKTGTAIGMPPAGAADPSQTYGWFVGWASKDGRTVVFARLLRDRTQARAPAGPRVRQAFLRDLPARLATLD